MEIAESDVVVGIFWKRFGTPTGDAQSGTEHELRKAWEAWRQSGRPDVMVYFSQQPAAPATSVELEQWHRVVKFREELPKEQLWWSYTTPVEFERLVREHLEDVIVRRASTERSTTSPKTAKVFISYRRTDTTSGYASWIYDKLAESFGAEQVFMDVDSLPLGVDFVEHLHRALDQTDVALILIGPGWLDAEDDSGNRRLDDLDDFVRVEVAAALRASARVIPVLVDGAQMPTSSLLPEDLRTLTRRHALTFHRQGGAAIRELLAAVHEAASERGQPRHQTWQKRLRAVADRPQSGGARDERWREIWGRLIEKLRARDASVTSARTGPNRSHFGTPGGYVVWFSREGPRAELYLDYGEKDRTKAVFDALAARKDEIEQQVGDDLSWERLDERQASRVALYTNGSADLEGADLDALLDRLVDMLLRLRSVLPPFVAEAEQSVDSGPAKEGSGLADETILTPQVPAPPDNAGPLSA